MLHSKDRKSSKKSLSTLTLFVAALSVILFGCTGRGGRNDSAFGDFAADIDTLSLRDNQSKIIANFHSEHVTDSSVKLFYKGAKTDGFSTPWIEKSGVSADADSLLAILRKEVPSAGLDTTAFLVPEIARDLDIVRKLAFDSAGVSINEILPRLDFELSIAYVRYTTGQRYGFVNPEQLLNRHDVKARDQHGKAIAWARLFDYTIPPTNPSGSLSHLNEDNRIEWLKSSEPDNYEYKVLKDSLMLSKSKSARRTLALNMERCRWKKGLPGKQEKCVFVNIPSLQLWAISPDTVLNMRICCGAVATKTPLLSSRIHRVDINPDWIIPYSIIANEIAPHSGDSAYFARRRYHIISTSTNDTVSPKSLSPHDLRTGRYRVVQTGGSGNSLGRLVFRFKNDFAVYLHDTNNRGAFNQERRTLSHGCVRVADPFGLANFIMDGVKEEYLDKVRISIDMPPATESGKELLKSISEKPRPHRLLSFCSVETPVAVYIDYFTAWPNPKTGEVEFWQDVYSYDRLIGENMSGWLE